jgi:hypothetical protein
MQIYTLPKESHGQYPRWDRRTDEVECNIHYLVIRSLERREE